MGVLSGAPQYSYLYEKFRLEPREPWMSRTLILLGLLLIAVGLLWPWIGWRGLGHLPGDIVVGADAVALSRQLVM